MEGDQPAGPDQILGPVSPQVVSDQVLVCDKVFN